jgi:hypothetical protein
VASKLVVSLADAEKDYQSEGLARDLTLYFPGIASTLSFASLSVRPLFLSLIEAYLLNLNPISIRPALKAIILALLPGLEEETSDDFETTLRIVNKFRTATLRANAEATSPGADTDSQYFWQCLFLASITNPSRRLGVLAYLNRHMPKLGGIHPWPLLLTENGLERSTDISTAAKSLISPEPGLLVRCFATGLADEQLLVQRNFLDLLVSHLPLHSPVLQRVIPEDDLGILVAAAVGVVIRRDMSLNRRLWSWFLGPEFPTGAGDDGAPGSHSPQASHAADPLSDSDPSRLPYFGNFGLKPLVQSIKAMIDNNSLLPSERAKPFRISLSLMDRWEVGGLVIPEVFLPIMRSVQQYKQLVTSKAQFDEVFRSASVFFDGVESNLIFSELLTLIHLDPSSIEVYSSQAVDDLKLAGFIISHFNLREEEMLIVHVPLLLLSLLVKMRAISSAMESEPASSDTLTSALDEASMIVNQLLDLIPDRAFLSRAVSNPSAANAALRDQKGIADDEISDSILDFYRRSRDSIDLPTLPFLPKDLRELMLREAHCLALSALESDDPRSPLRERANLLISLLKKTPKSQLLRCDALFQVMYRKLSLAKASSKILPFSTIASITSVAVTLYSIHTVGFYVNYEQTCDLIPLLVQQLWEFLTPSSPKFHVEAVRCLWHLHSVSWQDHLVEASVASLMISSDFCTSSHLTTSNQAEKFFVLWNHSHQTNLDLSAVRFIPEHTLNVDDSKNARFLYRSSMLDRPLFIVLDLLSDTANEASLVVREWLQDLSSVHK